MCLQHQLSDPIYQHQYEAHLKGKGLHKALKHNFRHRGQEGRAPRHPTLRDDPEGEIKDAVTHSVLTLVGVGSSCSEISSLPVCLLQETAKFFKAKTVFAHFKL